MSELPISEETQVNFETVRALVRNALGLLGTRTIRKAATFLALALIARALPPGPFRSYSLALALAELFRGLLGFSADQLVVQAAAERPSDGAPLASALVLKVFLALLGAGLAAGTSVALQYPGEVLVSLPLVAAYLIASGMNESTLAFFQGRGSTPVIAGLVAAATMGYIAALALLGRFWPSLTAYLAALAGFELVVLAPQLSRIRRLNLTALEPTASAIASLLRAGWPLGLSALLILVYFRVDTLLLGRLRPAEVDLYFASYKLTEASLLVGAAAGGALLPELTKLVPKNLAVGAGLLRRSIQVIVIVMFCVEAVFIAAGPQLARLMYGDRFQVIWLALCILGLATMIMSINTFMTVGIVSFRAQKWLLPITAAGVFINVVLNLLLIPPYGYQGAAWATVATETANLAMQGGLLWRLLRQPPFPWASTGVVVTALIFTIVLIGNQLGAAGAAVRLSALAAGSVLGILLMRGYGRFRMSLIRSPRPLDTTPPFNR